MSLTRAVLKTLVAGTALVLLVGCGAAEEATPTPTRGPIAVASPTVVATPTPSAKQPKYGGVLVVAQRGDPATWDPMQGTVTAVGLVHPLYGEGNLIKACRTSIYEFCPALAESWEANADFTQWTFKIRANALWHDGKPFAAEDARWWVDLSTKDVKGRAPNRYKVNFGPIKSVDVLDGNRVRLSLSQPRPAYLESVGEAVNHLAHPPHLMQPELDKGNANVGPQDVGWVATGPFKMLKYEKGSVASFRRFDRYWEKDEAGRQLPFLDGVDFPIITDPSAVVAAFRTGRVDSTAKGSGFHLTPEQKASIERDLRDKAYFVSIPYLAWSITPNSRKAPWNDVRVRKALSLWLDRDEGVRAVHGGFAEVSTFWSPKSPWVNPDYRTWPGYNPQTKQADRAEAKKLLQAAGFPNGFKTALLCRDLWIQWCEYLQGQLAGLLGAGNASIDIKDQATRQKLINASDFDIHLESHSSIFPTASASDFLTTAQTADVKHDDKKVDAYFERLDSTPDYNQRVKLAREIERYILQEQYLTSYLFYETGVLAYRSYVQGVPVPQQNTYYLADFVTTWLDK